MRTLNAARNVQTEGKLAVLYRDFQVRCPSMLVHTCAKLPGNFELSMTFACTNEFKFTRMRDQNPGMHTTLITPCACARGKVLSLSSRSQTPPSIGGRGLVNFGGFFLDS